MQELCDCSVVERIACCCGDFAVGRNFSLGDGTNDAAKGGIARFIFAERIFQDSSLEILRRGGASHEQDFIRADGHLRVDTTVAKMGTRILDLGHPSSSVPPTLGT